MIEYYEICINNSIEFRENQKQIHINLEEIDLDGLNAKLENLDGEILKSSELVNSLEPTSNLIEEINVKLNNELNESFKSFIDYILNEVGEESIDFTLIEDARKGFIGEFNNKIEKFSKSFTNALEDPTIFVNIKTEIIDIHLASFKKFSEQIDEYINFLEEKKENIIEILQKESNIKNKIVQFKVQEFSQFPSYQSIIDLEEQVEKISSLEISKLLDMVKKERNQGTDNEGEDKNV